MRDSRMKILLDGLWVLVRPKRLDQGILRDSSLTAARDKAKNVSRPPGRPRVRCERPFRVTIDLGMSEEPHGEICHLSGSGAGNSWFPSFGTAHLELTL